MVLQFMSARREQGRPQEGNKPVLVKYQLKVPILGYCSRYRYDLILPVDSAETKAGGGDIMASCTCSCGGSKIISREPDKSYGMYYIQVECDKCGWYWEGYYGRMKRKI